ncbi:MAG: 3-isopropylmalate dehydratase small subunit [Dehalococcoidia bacterium]|nr:3-isopropylmalate dehydratase small subunit [Chloroflexota bacterium]MDP6055748.1 3-isopropylmalate dehydratase small subunit [Dehalococcoidia bacterium]MDP7089779.1 3-isopropylmalate dehydratase small subunit [Dehalococcoidia bacterium]MDP7261812.1 3-isopropylmalate dehydratase small subunit [Dehalococcoidia bacterium]MDP7484732.1 3-isopropylmalate dehydratase small subunit [Dehalococcoidia bacterium]
MEKFNKLTSIVAPLDRANVDTDQIIPKQFLKRIERTGFGEFAFFDWRYLEDGVPNPDFILNEDRYQGANVLVGGRNFGSGSSREHAPWALKEMGFQAIIATSFADIFRNNCMQNGLLPVILSESEVDTIMARALRGSGYRVTVDLESQTVTDDQGLSASFDVDPFRKNSLLEGLDDVGITLSLGEAIDSFEKKRTARW